MEDGEGEGREEGEIGNGRRERERREGGEKGREEREKRRGEERDRDIRCLIQHYEQHRTPYCSSTSPHTYITMDRTSKNV